MKGRIALGALGVLAVLYALRRRNAAHEASAPTPAGNFVGAPGYEWSLPDVFPSELSFGDALFQLGYPVPGFRVGEEMPPDWSILNDDVRPLVAEFQRDFNLVDQAFNQGRGAIPATDGLIGPETEQALVQAFSYADQMGFEWPMVVSSALQQEGVADGVA